MCRSKRGFGRRSELLYDPSGGSWQASADTERLKTPKLLEHGLSGAGSAQMPDKAKTVVLVVEDEPLILMDAMQSLEDA